MRSFPILLIVLAVHLSLVRTSAAEDLDAALRQVSLVARTNPLAALKICDQVVTENPSNAQPFVLRARLKERAGQFDAAISDLTQALKLEPQASPYWQGRGEINFKAGHFKESVADFDRVLELVPTQAPYHWQRGISLYYAGRFADGRKQFESHRTVNPNDVENSAWHFLCAAREGSVTNARASMIAVGTDGRIPMSEIDALYRGPGTVQAVLTAARQAGGARAREALFYAHLYLGLYFEVLGETSKAREHILMAASDATATHYMGDVARIHARQFKAAPSK